MKNYICLRDDDTSFYTTPEELIEGYGSFWGDIPVTLATVPFVHVSSIKLSKLYVPGKDKYQNLREFERNADADYLTDYHKTHPIGDNKSLLDMLKPMVESGKVEIAQHGVTHKYSETGPEMLSTKISFETIRDGKEYLEKVFNISICTFIPPSNTIDVQCVHWINQLGLHLLSSNAVCVNGNYKKRAIDYRTLPNRIVAKLMGKSWYYRPVNHYFGMNIINSFTYGVSTDYDAILSKINDRLNRCGFAAIGTHYTCFEDVNCRKNFWKLLSTLRDKENLEFVTAKRYYDLLINRYKQVYLD